MTGGDIAEARRALTRLDLFRDAAAEASVERLGGLTNLVFRVDHGGRSYCLRLPGKGTEEYIDRRNEQHAARGAARAGVSPAVLLFDESGVMVTEYLHGTTTMSPRLFNTIPGAPGRAGRVFRRLHDSGETFTFRFELFGMIDGYLKVLSTKDVVLPEGYHETLAASQAVREALAAHELPLRTCHCDPLAENFLDAGDRMWIVDWEYSGMNDPMWDLGDLAVEAGFGPEQEEEMIRAYFGGEPGPAERGRIVIYKAMCDLLWTLWGLIQVANKNPVDDFWAYSINRLTRCRGLMSDPRFTGHVEAVSRG